MKSMPDFNEIFAVLSAVSAGDVEARISLPDETESDDPSIKLGIALNQLLDGFHERIQQLENKQKELEERLAERSLLLKKSDDKFARAFRSSPAGIAIAALPEGRWIEVNEALGKMTGYSREEMLGRTSVELNLVDEVARAKMLKAIQEEGMIHNVEIQITTKTKERRDVLVSVEQIELDGQPCGITIQYDITERKQLEAAMLELALERNQASMFQRFIGGVSHDLRTPLSTIKSILYLLKKNVVKQQLHYLGILETRTSQIVQIVEDMLYLSTLDNELDLDIQASDLGALLRNMVNDAQAQAQEKKQSLSLDENIEIHPGIDRQAIEQTLKHLLRNAIAYTPENGSIHIQAIKEGEEVIVAIEDNGIGISAEDLPQIFERFYRADKARNTETGRTGIGLSICKKIIEKHGGRIWVESVLGLGSTFYFSLPLRLEMPLEES